MAGVGTVMTEHIVGGSTANTTAYKFRGRVYTPEGTLVRHAGNGATSPMDDGMNIMLDVGVFCPCCAKTAENITVGGRMVSCNHTASRNDTYDPVTSGDTKAQFAQRLQHFKALESKGDGSGDLRVDVSEPLTPRDELLNFVSDLNDMFRPSEDPSPGSERPRSAADKSSLSSPRTPDSAGRSSLTNTSSISESLETSLRSINELADEWGCRGEEPLRPGVPAPSRRRFPSQECMASRPLNGHVTFSDDVRRPRMNTVSAADGVEMRRIGGAAYTANRHKRFSDDVTMFCYHNATMEPPVRNAMSVSPVGTQRPGDNDTGSSSDESRALDELLAELTGTSFKKQRRTKGARDRSAGNCATTNMNGVIVGAPFVDSPDGRVTNLQRHVSGQTTSSLSSQRSTAATPPIANTTHTGCEQRRACYPAACNNVGPVVVRPTTLSHVGGQGCRTIRFEDDENDEMREIASLSRTISSGCSNDILVEVVTNALKRSVTREYSARSDSPEADIDMVLEHADTEIFTGDVTLRRVFSVQRERDDSCSSHARRSPFSRLSTPDKDAANGGATCEHCGFAYGSKRRTCENEARHGGVVVQQKWSIKNNTITTRSDAQATSPSATTTREHAIYTDTRTRQDVRQAPRPVQDWKLETVHVEQAVAQKASEPEPMSVRTVQTRVHESSLESAFEEALENVTDADSSFHEDTPAEKPREKSADPTDEVVDLSQYDFVKFTRPPPTSSCECIADDRSSRSINDVDTDTSCTHSGGDVTTDDSDPEWADYKEEKRGSFGQLIGDTLRMTEEILATFEHIDVGDEEDVGGVESTPAEDTQAAPKADTTDLLRSQSDRAMEDRVVQCTLQFDSVGVSSDAPTASLQPVNGSAKTNESEDREDPTVLETTRAEGHQELRREVFVANTVADSEECFFPYLEVIPPSSPRIQKAPCIIEPSTPVDEPPKREAIFTDLVVSSGEVEAVDGVKEMRSRGATPDVDRLFVQASRELSYDSESDVLGDMCVTTDEEPDLDALVESNLKNSVVTRTSTEQEDGKITGNRASEVALAVNGSDIDKRSPNTKKKRKYKGARERVDVTQFAQFRPIDVVDRSTDEISIRVEQQDAELTKAETETVLTQDNNEHTALPPDSQSKSAYVNERKETIVDNVNRHVENDTTPDDAGVSAEVGERVERRDFGIEDVEKRAHEDAYTAELPESIQQPKDNDTATDCGWRTVLCEESSELANSPCLQMQHTPSPSGARYVYRATSTRGNTERFDEMKRRAGLDVDVAVTAAGEDAGAEEKVVSEELDIKKVTLLFTLPKELGPVLPKRSPGSTGGKKRIHIRRVTRIKADGTVEVIQAPTVQTIRYTPHDKAAITNATTAPSSEQKDATPRQSADAGHAVRSSNDADGKSLAQNTRKADPVPIEINMKYRHTKLRKYCKVAPLKHCAIAPASATSPVTPSGDQNGTHDGAKRKELTPERPGAEEFRTGNDIGKIVNGTVEQMDTGLNGKGQGLHSKSSYGRDIKATNGVETDITATDSKVSHTATANSVSPQRSTAAPLTQNGSVAKAKQPPKVKPKPKIPSWLATQLSTEEDGGENKVGDVNDDTVTEPAAGPVVHRDTTTAPPVMRSFKETTL